MESLQWHNIGLIIFFSFGMLWVAVPTGLALGVPIWLVALIAIPGSIAGAALMFKLTRPIQNWIERRYIKKHTDKISLVQKIWNRGGVPALGIIGPLIMGPPPTMAVGLLLGAPKRALLFWTATGIIIWTNFMFLAWIFAREYFNWLF